MQAPYLDPGLLSGFGEISSSKEDSYLGRGLIMSSVSQLDVMTARARNEEELVCVARFFRTGMSVWGGSDGDMESHDYGI